MFGNGSKAFNQPLNFDTSSVTDMRGMFAGARAFNQPLSFDTSSVTDMSSMFEVRPARASRPMSNYSLLHAACTTTAPQYLTPHVIPHVHVHVHVCTHHEPPFDLAVCGWLQPASEFRRVQRHEHEPDV